MQPSAPAGCAAPPDDAGLDLPRLRGLCPDAVELRRLLAMAREQLHADLLRMYRALDRGDVAAAAERIHHIKGAACMLCRPGDVLLARLDAARTAVLYCGSQQDAGWRDAARRLLEMEQGLQRLDSQLQAAHDACVDQG